MSETEVPRPTARRRMDPADEERAGRLLLAEYEQGASIRELATKHGYSIGRLRRLLTNAGVTFRRPGGATRNRGGSTSSSSPQS